MRTKLNFLFAFFSLTALSFSVFNSQAVAQTNNQNLAQDLRQAFRQFDVVKLSARDAAQAAETGRLKFVAAERAFDLNLQPRDLLARSYKAEETAFDNRRVSVARPAVQTFKGSVAGEAESKVRLSIANNKVAGYIFVGEEQFFIEPAQNISSSAANDDFVVYNRADVLNDQPLSCDLDEQVAAASERYNNEETVQTSANSFRVVEIATDADYEFTQARGGAANAMQEGLVVLNLIEGRFEAETGITFAVTYQHAWTTPDPYNTAMRPPSLPASIGSSPLNHALGWFAQTWNSSFPTAQYPRDVAHLFTGKAGLIGQGVAFTGTVCANPNFAYSLNGYIDAQSAKYLLAAHELGHNLGATHADAAQSCGNSIMNTQLSGDTALTFCQLSRDQINNFVAGNNGCMTTATQTRAKYDFDGDSRTDIAVYRRSNQVWYRLNSRDNSFAAVQFGIQEDVPTPEDFDGDGKTDIAVFRPSSGLWYILKSTTNTFASAQFGANGDVPAPADFSGDGKAELAVFRPTNGTWYTYNLQNAQFAAAQFGTNGDVPVPNDFDGDGKADYAVFRPSNQVWYELRSAQGFLAVQFGAAGDRLAPADFNGDGKTDIAVFRPSNGVWYTLQSGTNAFGAFAFGASGDVPAVGDFDGDGRADASVFRPAGGVWYRLNSNSNNSFSAAQFGLSSDLPVPSAYVAAQSAVVQ